MRRGPRCAPLATLLLVGIGLVAPAIAGAGTPAVYTWSGPIPIQRSSDGSFESPNVECPTARLCVTTGARLGTGDLSMWMLSFDPLAPPKVIAPAQVLVNGATTIFGGALSCPSATECTTVNSDNQALTLAPPSPNATVSATGLESFVACPSSTQCTSAASDHSSDPPDTQSLVTFNPVTPGPETSNYLTSGQIDAPAQGLSYYGRGFQQAVCPSAQQCTAVRSPMGSPPAFTGVHVVTFDPTGQGTPVYTTLFPDDRYPGTTFLACPTTSECVVIANSGLMTTFDPMSPGQPPMTTLDVVPNHSNHLSCPSATQCIVGSGQGNILSFDPTNPSTQATEQVTTDEVTSLGCASPDECVVLSIGNGTAAAYVGTVNLPSTVSPVTVGPHTVRGTAAAVPVTCGASTPSACPVTLTLTAALTHGHAQSVGHTSRRIAAGHHATLAVGLNRGGRRILARTHRLVTTLRVIMAGKTRATRTVTFRRP